MFNFYYQKHGGTYGPVPKSSIIDLLRSNEIDSSTLIRMEGVDEWRAVSATEFAGYASKPTAVLPKIAQPISQPQTVSSASGIISFIALVLLIPAGLGMTSARDLFPWSQRFSAADVDSTMKDIREAYSKDGRTVISAYMLRKSHREMIGYVRFKISDIEATHKCEALMDYNDGRSAWQCRP